MPKRVKLFLMIKKQIKDIQYAYDDPKEYSVNINNNYYLEDYQIKAKKLELNSRGLKISEELFPGLYKSIKNVVEKVNITNEISFFLMPDTALNAYCLPLTNKESAIIINSSLVELLDQKEMEFSGYFCRVDSTNNIINHCT